MSGPQAPRGTLAERAAAGYLQGKGWRILARNVRRRVGEIDLVAVDPAGVLVFVEVRARRAWKGEPGARRAAASVDRRKQARLARAAAAVVARWPHLGERPARFDVIAVESDGAGRPVRLYHLRGAFEVG